MGQIAPALGADGADNGYAALVAKFTILQSAAANLLAEAERLSLQMRVNADAATAVSDLCAVAEVDARHVATVATIGAAFGRVVTGCTGLMGAADTLHTAVGHLKAEHQAEYGGIYEAVAASGVRQAKPGFYRPT
ncbi:conjugal transfer protein TraB [Streptomyces rochei]|uniref:conjugal transfer protein TraB n=1 Tax=Streptomyces rochei TaxID=1928 RepID=UPI00367C1ED7